MRKPKSDFPYTKSCSKKSFVTAVTLVVFNTEANVTSNANEIGDKLKCISSVNRDAFVKLCAFCEGDHAMEACQAMNGKTKIPHRRKLSF